MRLTAPSPTSQTPRLPLLRQHTHGFDPTKGEVSLRGGVRGGGMRGLPVGVTCKAGVVRVWMTLTSGKTAFTLGLTHLCN